MTSQTLLITSMIFCGLSLIIQIVFLFIKSKKTPLIAHGLLLLSGVIPIATILYRSILIHFVAITNMYESLVFFSGITALLTSFYAIKGKKVENKAIIFGGTIITLLLLSLSSSPLAPNTINPPIPALKSIWLILHVSFTFIGESFLAVAFVTALLHVFSKNKEKLEEYDRLTYTCVGIGYPIFTIGALIFGMIWAENAWGNWWSWDPKETWALITWLVYTAYLHLRLGRKKNSKLTSMLVIIGFLLAMFTFFGVNFLLKGLHSYT